MESKQGVRETFSVLREEPEPGLGGDRAEIFIVDYRGARVARMLRAFWRELTPREREAGMTKAYTRRSAKETEALAQGIVLAANSYSQLTARVEVLQKALKEALDHAAEISVGCLYCGGDDEYVEEHGDTSAGHKSVCWYYKASALLSVSEGEKGK